MQYLRKFFRGMCVTPQIDHLVGNPTGLAERVSRDAGTKIIDFLAAYEVLRHCAKVSLEFRCWSRRSLLRRTVIYWPIFNIRRKRYGLRRRTRSYQDDNTEQVLKLLELCPRAANVYVDFEHGIEDPFKKALARAGSKRPYQFSMTKVFGKELQRGTQLRCIRAWNFEGLKEPREASTPQAIRKYTHDAVFCLTQLLPNMTSVSLSADFDIRYLAKWLPHLKVLRVRYMIVQAIDTNDKQLEHVGFENLEVFELEHIFATGGWFNVLLHMSSLEKLVQAFPRSLRVLAWFDTLSALTLLDTFPQRFPFLERLGHDNNNTHLENLALFQQLPNLTAFPESLEQDGVCAGDDELREQLKREPLSDFNLKILSTCVCLGCAPELVQIAPKLERLRVRYSTWGKCCVNMEDLTLLSETPEDDLSSICPVTLRLSTLSNLLELHIEGRHNQRVLIDIEAAASFARLSKLKTLQMTYVEFQPKLAVLCLASSLSYTGIQTLELKKSLRVNADIKHRLKMLFIHYRAPLVSDINADNECSKLIARIKTHSHRSSQRTCTSQTAFLAPRSYTISFPRGFSAMSLVNGQLMDLVSHGIRRHIKISVVSFERRHMRP